MMLARFDRVTQRKGLPNPYKSGYIGEQLLDGKAAFLSLISKKGFYRRFIKAHTGLLDLPLVTWQNPLAAEEKGANQQWHDDEIADMLLGEKGFLRLRAGQPDARSGRHLSVAQDQGGL